MNNGTIHLLAVFRDNPDHLTTEALSEILKQRGLKPKGTRTERIEQINELMPPEETGYEPESKRLPEAKKVQVEGMVTTQPPQAEGTPGDLLNAVVSDRADALTFDRYNVYLDDAFCSGYRTEQGRIPYFGSDAYEQLKRTTETFLMCEAGKVPRDQPPDEIRDRILARLQHREPADWQDVVDEYREKYLKELGREMATLPYFERIIGALEGLPLKRDVPNDGCYGILRSRVSPPCLLELLWSYWLEEGLLMQTMNAISLRFQNKRSGGGNPLAHLEIDPLRPLNNLIWGWIQDEPRRLTVVRRAYEYDHHYGLRLVGKAIPDLQPADSRTQFLEAFHNLLYLATVFFKEEDDRNITADGFPVLNALKELHLVLAHGAHNQFGDLPWQARVEMLIVQWLLARPEMREFLGGRAMVPYPEPWMGRVDTMISLQGWGTGGVTPFRDLALYGEQIVLSVRYHDWVSAVDAPEAAGWAKYWRSEIQAYVHAYRSVTGVDLSADPIHQDQMRIRFAQPSTLLVRRNGSRTVRSSTPA